MCVYHIKTAILTLLGFSCLLRGAQSFLLLHNPSPFTLARTRLPFEGRQLLTSPLCFTHRERSFALLAKKKKNKKVSSSQTDTTTSKSKGFGGSGSSDIQQQQDDDNDNASPNVSEFMEQLTTQDQIKVFGRAIDPMPDFCTEALEALDFDALGINVTWAKPWLEEAWEENRHQPHLSELDLKRPDYRPDAPALTQRLNLQGLELTAQEEKLKWWNLGGQSPDGIFEPRVVAPFSPKRYTFSHQLYPNDCLQAGKTHVAVGFVDLAMLMDASSLSLNNSDDDESAVVRFVGVDASVHAVAKSRVIWKMLQQTPLLEKEEAYDQHSHFQSIAQAWFSSTWGPQTHEAVQTAIKDLLLDESSDDPSDAQVQALLHHWNRVTHCPLNVSRTSMSETKSHCAVGHLLDPRDRIELARYELTGDFCVNDQGPIYSNLLTFDCPYDMPPLALDETVFAALPWPILMEIITNDKNLSILGAAEQYALQRIAKLAEWARDGVVEVELKCSKLEDAVEWIAEQKPWTMSWSNLVDSMDYQEFHKLARQCSVHGDTIHYGYSTEWPGEVYAAMLTDFRGPKLEKVRSEMIRGAIANVLALYTATGWDQRLRIPPPTDPMTTTSAFVLQLERHEDWIQHFFSSAHSQGPCQVGNVETQVAYISPLSYSDHFTLAFTFTYDPEINFQSADFGALLSTT